MILTGREIEQQVRLGSIHIDPFDPAHLQPNSYDFTLGHDILVYEDNVLDSRKPNSSTILHMGEEGMVLWPGRIYLGHTLETIGSVAYVPTIRARSSVARLGLFVHVTADLIDIGFIGQFTLQLNPVQPVRVYPKMRIGQVTFWCVQGDIHLYSGKYRDAQGPRASMSYLDFRNSGGTPT